VQVIGGIFPVKGALRRLRKPHLHRSGGFGAGAKQAIGRKIMAAQIAALYEQLRARSKR
jgi:hypothetical protein